MSGSVDAKYLSTLFKLINPGQIYKQSLAFQEIIKLEKKTETDSDSQLAFHIIRILIILEKR